MLLVSSLTFAQSSVRGTITDQAGDPIIGASVSVKGAKGAGAVSDTNGSFSITVPSTRSQLVVSYVGYETQTVSLAGQTSINVVLTEDRQTLNEVVVVGYGVMKRSDLTGSVVD